MSVMGIFHRHSWEYRGCVGVEHCYGFRDGFETFPHTVKWSKEAENALISHTIRSALVYQCVDCGKARTFWEDGDWSKVILKKA